MVWNIFKKSFILILIVTNIVFSHFVELNELDTLITFPLDSSKISILNVSYSANAPSQAQVYYQTVNEVIERPLKVRVLYDNLKPIENYPVHFSIISFPPKSTGTKFKQELVLTDANGYAESYAILGSEKGEYEFSARIKNATGNNDIVYFKAYARESNWVFTLFTGLIGGLALFLFGMELLSDGMKKTAGSKLRSLLVKLTNNRIIGVSLGVLISMLIQSSATTVLLVSFVQAQLMTFSQSLGIILGAGIGTTITAQMIAFKLTDFSLLFIGLGFAIVFFAKTKKIKHIGTSILGFGILFFGMWIMSDSMYVLRTYQPFIDILSKLENPILGVIIGGIFTAIIQSSAAFVGIVIILGSQGLVSLEAAIPLILGTNVGTSITAILASLNTGREAKRVAIAHTSFKLFGVLLFIWWIPQFAKFISIISPQGSGDLIGLAYRAEVLPRQIANAHTVFNVLIALILLPFTNIAAAIITKIFPNKPELEDKSEFKVKYLEESLVNAPSLALNLAKAEIIRMAVKVQKMVENILTPFIKNEWDILDAITKNEKEIDFLNIRISKYLVKIGQESMPEERVDEVFQLIHCVTELEQIADLVAKRLKPLAKKRLDLNLNFSEDGKQEIENYHLKTVKQISRAIEVLKDVNLEDAKKMEEKYKKYRLMELDLRRTHFDRLRQQVPGSEETSQLHLDLVEALKRISSHATNIARIFLEMKREHSQNTELENPISEIEKSNDYYNKNNSGTEEKYDTNKI